MNYKISIVMPVYNTEEYIERAVTSVLNQTYRNIELICVDDGSTDKSGELLDRLAKSDFRLKVIHNQNMGVSRARNTALSMATGDYIGFVDSDDYIDPQMYELLLKHAINNNADMVTCGYFFDRFGVITPAINKKEVEDRVYDYKSFLRYMYERDTYNAVAGYLWTKLIKRSILINENNTQVVYFQKKYGGADDIVFVAEVTRRCNSICYVNKPLYYYFERTGSIVHDDRKQLETLHWLKSYQYIIKMYKMDGVDKDVIDIICRMYIYRCAKTLELAIAFQNDEKKELIKPLIYEYKDVYMKTNGQYPERIEWLENLLNNS